MYSLTSTQGSRLTSATMSRTTIESTKMHETQYDDLVVGDAELSRAPGRSFGDPPAAWDSRKLRGER